MAPKDSQSQAKGQKNDKPYYSFVFEIGKPISFFITSIEVKQMSERRKAIVSVIGKDQVGIIAKVTTVIADRNINILDISQTILQDFFTMMMVIDVTDLPNLETLQQELNELGQSIGVVITVQLEEIFQAMHRV